jgi:hypothetical protein
MSYFLEQPELFDQALRLGKEERKNPFKVLEDFFDDYRLYECRQQLWDMVECCLTADNEPYGEAGERAVLLQQYKDLEGLLEAAWLIVQQDKGPGSPGPLKVSGKGKAGPHLSSLNAPAASKAPISGPATGIHA